MRNSRHLEKIKSKEPGKQSSYYTRGEMTLRAAIDDIASQLGITVDGHFDFTVRASVADETLDKLAMLINFVIEAARRLLSELKDRNARLAELDHMKSVFLANISHELRTPLALILGPTEKWLSSSDITEEQHRDLDVVMRNARSLLKTVNDLLDVSKLEAGKLSPEYARVDLSRIVRLTCSLFEVIARGRNVDYTVEVPDILLAEVDPEMIQRVLLNLLSNSFKFGAGGGRIACVLEAVGNNAVLQVQDNGPGIPIEMRERIFERFIQVEGDVTRKHGGTGLGLAIVKEFVELHNGSIQETTPVGGGAAFVVTLPLKAPADVAVGRAPAQDFAPTGSSTSVLQELRMPKLPVEADSADRMRRGTILVVEDNRDMNQFIVETLRDEYHVISAFDGKEGLEKTLKHKPDLVLSDIMMPEVGGEEMVSEMRRRPELSGIGIILLTAKADEEVRVRLLQAGAQDFVTKPFLREEVRARVRNIMSGKRTRDLLKRELHSSQEDLEELAQEVSLKRHELEKSIEETRASRDEVQRLLQLRDEFISIAGHELKTPLTPLSLQRQMIDRILRSSDLPESVKEQKLDAYLEMSKRQIDALTKLVETLLDVSQIRLGRFSIKPETNVDLFNLVQEVVERYRPQWEIAHSPVKVECLGESLKGHWDRLRMDQVISNLLTNAIKYGCGKPIELTISGDMSVARISIRDDGPGISKADQTRIFNRFERAGSIASFGGLGLGLYITRQIVAAHGGTISIDSEVGNGATFIIDLPLKHRNSSILAPAAKNE
jgi:signal transduction histidine kinase